MTVQISSKEKYILLLRKNGFNCFPIPRHPQTYKKQKAADLRYDAVRTQINQPITDNENYGYIPIKGSGNIILDFDDKERYRTFAENTIKAGYMVIESPHGWHIPVIGLSGDIQNKTELFDYEIKDTKIIEVIGPAFYCVGPESVIWDEDTNFTTQAKYENKGSDKIWNANGNDFDKFIDVICEKCDVSRNMIDTEKKTESNSNDLNQLKNKLSKLKVGMNRQGKLLSYGSIYAKKNKGMIDENDCVNYVLKLNNMLGEPYPEQRAIQIGKACYAYSINDEDNPEIKFKVELKKNWDVIRNKNIPKEEKEQAKKEINRLQIEWDKEAIIWEEEKESKGKKISDYADMIMQKYHFATIKDNETLLIYDDGIYTEKNAQYTIKEELEKTIDDCQRDDVNEVIAAIKRRTGKNREEFDADNDILNCENGLYNIKTKEFSIHSHTFFSRSKLAVKYDEGAVSEHFRNFLESCHPDNKEEIDNLLEEAASCLFFDIDLQKFFMHVGFGSNGKSIYFKTIEALLGKENVSNVSIHDLQNNRFAASRLDGKRANLHADIENDELNHLGKFKQLVSRDAIHVEEKGKPGYDMINKAQLFFSANQLPIIQENNNAVYRRPRITEWKVTFSDNPKEGERKKDPSLKLKLITENELSGILNLLLPYAITLKKNLKLTYDQTSEQVKKAWHEKSNPVQLFINEMVEEKPDKIIGTAKLYLTYSQWTRLNNVRTMTKFEFNKEFEQLISVEKTKGKYLGTSTTIWKGVTLKEKAPEPPKTKGVNDYGG